MNLSWLFVLVAVAVICNVAGSSILLESELHTKKCRYLTSYDLYHALCKDLKLNDIPKNLQSTIEVLDARENRIRELRKDSLAPYSKLRYLYLQDNFIQKISKSAFESVYYLEALDISKNGLREIPKELFQLKVLRNVYLNENNLGDSTFYVQDVQSPIHWLHLSGNNLTKIPHLYPMTSLTLLNVSHNPINWISPEDLAPFCSLQTLDLRGLKLKFSQNTCDCHNLFRWHEERGFKIHPPLDCPIALRERCNGIKFSNRTLSLHHECVMSKRERAAAIQARSLWIWIALSIGTFVTAVFVVLLCVHNRNKSQRERLKEQQIIDANEANTEKLLDQTAQQEQA